MKTLFRKKEDSQDEMALLNQKVDLLLNQTISQAVKKELNNQAPPLDAFDSFFDELPINDDIIDSAHASEHKANISETKSDLTNLQIDTAFSDVKDDQEAEVDADPDLHLDKKIKKQQALAKKQQKKAVAANNRKNKFPKTSQRTIPYKQMWKDGLCQLDKDTYSITFQYHDINYQLAKLDDREAIFEDYCSFLNTFDSSVHVQMTFVNQATKSVDIKKHLTIEMQNDRLDVYRQEQNEILMHQLSQGKNSIEKTKYITISIKAESKDAALQKLARIDIKARTALKNMGCKVQSLDGYDRLKLLHNILNQDNRRFDFNWDLIVKTGLTTKDFIAPDSFDFRNYNTFKINDKIGATSYVQVTASELPDEILAQLLDIDNECLINLHLQSIDQSAAMRKVKNKLSDLEQNKIEQQRKAVQSGYDMDILPPDLITYIDEAKSLLDDLQSRNERMFMATITITNFAKDAETLKNDLFQLESIVQSFNCQLRRLDFQQEDALISSLPLGLNRIDIKRNLTTSATAIFVPFTTQELYQEDGMYYGLNALSSNVILCNRKNLKNPNGLILGTPGSGKSFSSKREIVNVVLTTNDDVIIVDPEGEYAPLVQAMGGEVIKISTSSASHINPLDVDINDDDNPVALKADFVLSLCELLIGGKDGLSPVEKTVIDRCVHMTFSEYVNDPNNTAMPTLGDFYQVMKDQNENEANHIALSLELYINGSLNIFNNHTNINTQSRIICFDIKDLGKQLKKMGMMIVQEYVWNKVSINRNSGKKTWYYIDEFHLQLRDKQTAEYSVEIWKRFRKWGGIPTGITQNVKDFLASKEIENILENSDFIYLLNQASSDRQELANRLGISEQQLSHVTNSPAGHGLILFGGVIIPFSDNFPKQTQLYTLMTTNPEEVAKREETAAK